MKIKLKKPAEDLFLFKSREMQSKILALQSQMNPHFLYNTLATIGAMAEENMNDQIIEMCENVSDFLRYISSNKATQVPLKTELDYIKKYLSAMKIRFSNKLSYSLDFNEAILSLNIPKLIVQPLVENALKYGTLQEPPWQINVYGVIIHNYWNISIEDNGPGFSEEVINSIYSQISKINDTGLLPDLELNGMGILNIYIRLKLAYKDNIIFRITNSPAGGGLITIGGSTAFK